MSVRPYMPGVTSTSVRQTTTFLASTWGLASAYTLVNSLLITHDMRFCFAALAPLAAAWGTLERKRWGRLALLSLASIALGGFAVATGLILAMTANKVQLSTSITAILKIFGDPPIVALFSLFLSLITVLWLRRGVVSEEFNHGKRSHLSSGQKTIATAVVGSWCVTFFFAPFTANIKPPLSDQKTIQTQQKQPQKGKHKSEHKSKKVSNRSVADRSKT